MDDLARADRLQCHVTHNSELADLGTLTELLGLADELVAGDRRNRYNGRHMENPSGFIVETLIAVFQSLVDKGQLRGRGLKLGISNQPQARFPA